MAGLYPAVPFLTVHSLLLPQNHLSLLSRASYSAAGFAFTVTLLHSSPGRAGSEKIGTAGRCFDWRVQSQLTISLLLQWPSGSLPQHLPFLVPSSKAGIVPRSLYLGCFNTQSKPKWKKKKSDRFGDQRQLGNCEGSRVNN